MPFFLWSKTAATNGNIDSTINWAEGQAPSSVNDSARAMMARLGEYRDDISGALLTTGTSTAYSVISNQGFDTFAHLNGAMVAFTPHVTNGGTCTLNVDSLGAKPLRYSPSFEIASNSLLVGTPYVATYNNTAGEWYVHGGASSNPYNIPLAGGMDYWAPTAPNSAFIFPTGQALSRVTYATLFNLMGTAFGVGDGSTTFNVPDKRGFASAASDNMGGTNAGRISLGFAASGGVQNAYISQANLPAVALGVSGSASVNVSTNVAGATSAVVVSGTISGATSGYSPTINGSPAFGVPGGSTPEAETQTGGANAFPQSAFNVIAGFSSLSVSGTFTGAAAAGSFSVTGLGSGSGSVSGTTAPMGSGSTFSVLQPTLACNYILRVI